jgi:splicing suppressor protein 51
MSSNRTCQRCLQVVRRSSNFRSATRLPSTHRFSSTSSTSKLPKLTKPIVSQRQISTFESEAPVRETDFQYPGKAASLKPKADGTSDLSRTVLGPNNLFHPLTDSPIPSMRQRASFIKAHAYCPHPSHNRTRIATSEEDPETRKPTDGGLAPAHVKFECPHCGVPTFCSEDHWAEDYEEHMKVCDTLREINEDDHDLRSGRYFNEFDFPERYMEEAVSNFTNWDTLMYTRGFEAIDGERNMRHATRLLTYPVTVGSILHDLSPYNIRKDGRMTPEGLRSFTGM